MSETLLALVGLYVNEVLCDAWPYSLKFSLLKLVGHLVVA